MSWVKIDDRFWGHHKVIAAGNEAVGVWIRACSWTACAEQDGFIPDDAANLIAKRKVWQKLEEVRLVHREETGWRIHNFLEHNPSSEASRLARQKRAEAGRIGGKNSGKARRESSGDEANTKQVLQSGEASASADAGQLLDTMTNPVPSRPVPSRPNEETEERPLLVNPEPSPATGQVSRDVRRVFDSWLAEWRRVVGGSRAPILDAKRQRRIRARLAEGIPVDDLIAAARGIWASAWHVENGQTDIDLAVRDDAHVTRFAALDKPPAPRCLDDAEPTEAQLASWERHRQRLAAEHAALEAKTLAEMGDKPAPTWDEVQALMASVIDSKTRRSA
jgi:hypothetical protein